MGLMDVICRLSLKKIDMESKLKAVINYAPQIGLKMNMSKLHALLYGKLQRCKYLWGTDGKTRLR